MLLLREIAKKSMQLEGEDRGKLFVLAFESRDVCNTALHSGVPSVSFFCESTAPSRGYFDER